MKNKEYSTDNYLEDIDKHHSLFFSNIESANKLFDEISKKEVNFTKEDLVRLVSKDVSEWQKFWILRYLYLKTKDLVYINMLRELHQGAKDNLTKSNAGTLLRAFDRNN